MKISKISFLFLLAMGVVLFDACKEEDESPTPQEEPVVQDVTYTADVATILDASCAFSGCHDSGAMVGSLASYADAKAFAGWGKMIDAVKHVDGVSPMPKNQPKLSDETIATLEKWISDGLKE